jgi:hypothetical protein
MIFRYPIRVQEEVWLPHVIGYIFSHQQRLGIFLWAMSLEFARFRETVSGFLILTLGCKASCWKQREPYLCRVCTDIFNNSVPFVARTSATVSRGQRNASAVLATPWCLCLEMWFLFLTEDERLLWLTLHMKRMICGSRSQPFDNSKTAFHPANMSFPLLPGCFFHSPQNLYRGWHSSTPQLLGLQRLCQTYPLLPPPLVLSVY